MMQDGGALFGECDVHIELAITLHQYGDDTQARYHLRQALDTINRPN